MVAGLSDDCEEGASSGDDAGDENTRREAVTELYTTLGGEAGGQEESPEKRAAQFRTTIEKRLSDLESILGKRRLAAVAGKVILSTIDTKWTEHLGDLERADDAVGLRGYAQLDPLLEFTKEAYNLYRAMLIDIRTTTLARLLCMLPDGVQ